MSIETAKETILAALLDTSPLTGDQIFSHPSCHGLAKADLIQAIWQLAGDKTIHIDKEFKIALGSGRKNEAS